MSILSFFKRKSRQATVKKAGSKPFRTDIQALRALAVATVVLYHLWPNRMVGGFAGVDIFFVISGFLMTTSVMGHLTPHITAKTITVKNVLRLLAEFYARRIRRLVPAALTTLAGVLTLAYFTNNLTIMVNTAKNVIASATFWENWHLASQSVDYLHAGDAPVATEHFWSLSLEEQFYLMWPLLLVAATLLTLNVVVYYKKQRISGIILPITLLTLISFAYGYWLTHSEPSVAYFSTPARIWELMLGGIIAFLPTIKNYDLKLLLPHLGLAMCLYSVFFITGDGFPGWHALIPTLGTAMIIWAGIGKAESHLSFNDLFALKPIQWIGNISYSVYLWHFPLIVLLPVLIRHDIDGPHGKFIKLGIIVLSLILAQLSYMYVEETTRKVRLKLRYVYLLFFAATGIVVGGGFVLQHYGNTQIDTRLKAMHAAALDESNICFGARAIVNQDKCGDSYGQRNEKFTSVGQEDIYKNLLTNKFSECENIFDRTKKDQTKFCSFGDLNSDKNIYLYGDSHMEQYINALDYIGKHNNYKITLFDHTYCISNEGLIKTSYCVKRTSEIKKFLAAHRPEFMLVSFLNYDNTYAKNNMDIVSGYKNKIYYLSDSPYIPSNNFESCRLYAKKCNVKKDFKWSEGIEDSLLNNGFLKKYQIIPTRDMYCNGTICPQYIGGLQVYFNSFSSIKNSHISASYSYSLGPILEQKLKDKGLLQ